MVHTLPCDIPITGSQKQEWWKGDWLLSISRCSGGRFQGALKAEVEERDQGPVGEERGYNSTITNAAKVFPTASHSFLAEPQNVQEPA